MRDALLVLNTGSSSIKFALFAAGDRPAALLRGRVVGLPSSPSFRASDPTGRILGQKTWDHGTGLSHTDALRFLLAWARDEGLSGDRIIAAGHRVAHGGARLLRPVRVNAEVMRELESLIPLAPLHQPHNLGAIAAISRLAPGLPQVACFDTAFHHTQPAVARRFAIPRRYSEAGVRRYGFHGLSYEYIAGILRDIDARASGGRTVVAHLGNGASMCALREGRSVAATMGFTAMDGLVMGTRCGAIDPGVVIYLNQHAGLGMDEVHRLLYEQSGLLGASGISGDMRLLLASADPRAKEAVDLFVYRAVRELGSLAAALGGLDSLVFTGGIGENAASIRKAICDASAWLGLELDDGANLTHGPRISRTGAPVTAWVVPTNEELMIARHTARVLAGSYGNQKDDAGDFIAGGTGAQDAECSDNTRFAADGQSRR